MTVVVCPLDAFANACRDHAPSHVVSLLAPPAAAPALTCSARRLHLGFNDIAVATPGLVAPSAEHIADLLAFFETWDRRSVLLIHCWAGISRSTAAGYIAATMRDGPGSERTLVRVLRQRAPFATPNPLMIDLADAALGRNGEMSAAIASIGRGADAACGRPFSL